MWYKLIINNISFIYLDCFIHFIEGCLMGKYFTWIINQSLSPLPSTITLKYMKRFCVKESNELCSFSIGQCREGFRLNFAGRNFIQM